MRSIRDSGAQQVFVTHGQSEVLARYLREVEGLAAEPLDSLARPATDDQDA